METLQQGIAGLEGGGGGEKLGGKVATPTAEREERAGRVACSRGLRRRRARPRPRQARRATRTGAARVGGSTSLGPAAATTSSDDDDYSRGRAQGSSAGPSASAPALAPVDRGCKRPSGRDLRPGPGPGVLQVCMDGAAARPQRPHRIQRPFRGAAWAVHPMV